jgi:hypothetical protein
MIGKQKAEILTSANLTSLFLVRPRGLEPPHRFQYMHLKHARLPIPPWPQRKIELLERLLQNHSKLSIPKLL